MTCPPELSVLSGGRHATGRRLFFQGAIVPNRFYRAERDLAQECRASVALGAPHPPCERSECRGVLRSLPHQPTVISCF
jgi:hypothetical protein